MAMLRGVSSIVAGALGVAIVGAGCSYDWTFTEESGTSKDSGAEKEPAVEEKLPVGPPSGGECKSSVSDCPKSQYCLFKDGHCGRPDIGGPPSGFCVDIAQVCSLKGAPATCACDGTTVESACQAASAGLDVDAVDANCAPSGDTFKCFGAPTGCKRKAEYCLSKGEETGTCQPMPPECSTCADCKSLPPPPTCVCDDKSDPGAVMVKCSAG